MRFLRAKTTNNIEKQINDNQERLGEQAAMRGDSCPEGATESFVRGYATQYEIDHIRDPQTGGSDE